MKKLNIIIGLALALAFNAVAQNVVPLSTTEAAQTGWTHKIVLDYEDITTAAGAADTNVTFRIFPRTSGALDTNSIVKDAAWVLRAPFKTGGAAENTSIQFRVGDAGSNNRYAVQGNVGPTNTLWGSVGTTAYLYDTSTNYLTATFLGTNASSTVLDSLTQGRVDVYIRIVPKQTLP